MSEFEKRGKGEETKYVLEQEMLFKANARRNKLLGLWVAKLLKLSDEDSLSYALEMLRMGSEKNGDKLVFDKIRADIDAHGINQSDHQIRRTMDEFEAKALRKFERSS